MLQYLKERAKHDGYDALAWAVMKDNIEALDFYQATENFPNYISANELCNEKRGWRPDMCARSPPNLILSTPGHPLHSALTPSVGSVLFEPLTDKASTIARLPKFCIAESEIKDAGLGWFLLEEVGAGAPIWVYDIYVPRGCRFTPAEFQEVGVRHPRARHLHRCKPAPRPSVTLPHVFAQALRKGRVKKEYCCKRLVFDDKENQGPSTEFVESKVYGGRVNTGYGIKPNNARFSMKHNFIMRSTKPIRCV
jgi:hypothetical protein